jgi:uncharacterized membrane protein
MESTLRKVLLVLGIVAVLGGLARLTMAAAPQAGALVIVLGVVMIWLGRRTA